jgi:hypothetical protein
VLLAKRRPHPTLTALAEDRLDTALREALPIALRRVLDDRPVSTVLLACRFLEAEARRVNRSREASIARALASWAESREQGRSLGTGEIARLAGLPAQLVPPKNFDDLWERLEAALLHRRLSPLLEAALRVPNLSLLLRAVPSGLKAFHSALGALPAVSATTAQILFDELLVAHAQPGADRWTSTCRALFKVPEWFPPASKETDTAKLRCGAADALLRMFLAPDTLDATAALRLGVSHASHRARVTVLHRRCYCRGSNGCGDCGPARPHVPAAGLPG